MEIDKKIKQKEQIKARNITQVSREAILYPEKLSM